MKVSGDGRGRNVLGVHLWIVGLISNLAIAAGFLVIGWSLRGRQRQSQAISIHDDVVQGLVTAKLSLELGEVDRSVAILDETLDSARHLISNLLGEPGAGIRLGPGDPRRTTTTESP